MNTTFISPQDAAILYEEEKHIKDDDYKYFQDVVLDLAGISLTEKKRDLLKTRLGPYIRTTNFKNYTGYRKYLESLPAGHAEWQTLINLITTNKTDFFREIAHFKFVEENLIPAWQQAGKKKVRIWSAACSSGEEPYSLAMLLEKKLPKEMTYQILATDIDTEILSKASNGVYSMAKEHEIPEEFLSTSVDYGTGAISDWFRIKSKLKRKIIFQTHNLIDDNIPTGDSFDLILCRNVMIYFPKAVVEQVANKLFTAASDDGFFFIGHSETLQSGKTKWNSVEPAVYAKSSHHKRKKI